MWSRICVSLFIVAKCSASAVTPIEKVVGLLKDLQAKVEKQGAKEAAQYDKYSCFCKNQAEFKNSHIDKSAEKIKVFDADIKDLDANIKALNSDIGDLGKDIGVLKTDIKTTTDARDKESAAYAAKAKDLNEAIDACDEAIAALKDTKKGMTDAKLNLAQLKAAAVNAKVSQPSGQAMREALSLVRAAKKDAQESTGSIVAVAAPVVKFEYQSNDIIATIEDLATTFRENKKELDFTEFDNRDEFEKKILGFTNEQTFKEKDKKEKEVLSEEKTEEKQETEQSKDEEDKDKTSDEDFLAALTASCEQKAKDWDQRSKARSEEMTALAEATNTLENGAMQQYNVNKKLTGLVQDPVKKVSPPVPATKAAPKEEASKKSAPSFLQVRSVGSSQASAVKRMLANLDSAATRLRSPILAAVALKAQLKEDHFTNVRSLIKDLISKLKSDAKAESSTKNFCDLEMKKAVDNRDKAADNIEEQNGIMAKKASLADAKAEEVEDLSQQIAEINKDLLDAESLRKSEKADNEQAIAEAVAGAEAVKSALTTLKGFYGLVQTDYKPPKSDRSGKTVGDVAPEAFSGEYKGLGDSSKGILGILEVIQSDFERTETQTTKEEKKAKEDHEKFETDSNSDIKLKTQKKIDAGKAKEGAEEAIVQAKDDLYDAKTLQASALEELEKLSPMCVEGEETYAERVQKRKDELAALKEAYTILDDWQK